jgi:hypothetical protein
MGWADGPPGRCCGVVLHHDVAEPIGQINETTQPETFDTDGLDLRYQVLEQEPPRYEIEQAAHSCGQAALKTPDANQQYQRQRDDRRQQPLADEAGGS